jgi:DNA-binding response OmpR family regulator
MKILFAAPDRDLLECYKQLLETDPGETVTAFDGTQALMLLSAEDFDIVILDQRIPRLDYKVITERANEKNIPVILLTDDPAGARQREGASMNGRLSYPFTFAEIKKKILDTLEKRGIGERKGPVTEDE